MNSKNAGHALAMSFLMSRPQTPKTVECIMKAFTIMSKEDYQALKEFMDRGTFMVTRIEKEGSK